jgi:DNA primase
MDSDDIKEEIKRRADLAALVGNYVPLTRSGRRLKARCPFHAEKTPSFYVDPEGGFWKCFGCGEGGDVFSFLMKIENLSFPEAAERLAHQVGLEWRGQPVDAAKTERRKLLQRALDQAAEYFESRLQSSLGAGARDYLTRRGLREETVRQFRLGFAPPGWENLGRFLSGKGLPMDLLREVDLVRAREHSAGFYDTFRNRVMFPIIDASGHVIGFGGRTLDPDEPAKYLNSAETPLFKKGHHVYALPQARQAMATAGYVVLVEGYTDVLALHQAGFRQVVAALGTALTEDHVRLLGRYVETVVLAYDADTAGQSAALRNLEVFERVGVDAQVLALPGGVDPDEFIRAQGLPAWEKLLESRLSLAEYQLEMVFSRYRDQGEQGLTKAATHAVNILAKVRDRVRRDELIARAADRWGLNNPGRTGAMRRILQTEMDHRAPQQSFQPRDPRRNTEFLGKKVAQAGHAAHPWRNSTGLDGRLDIAGVERQLLCLALQDAEWCRRLTDLLREDDFSPGPQRDLISAVFAHRREQPASLPHEIVAALNEQGACHALAVDLLMTSLPKSDEEEILPLVEKLRKHRGAGDVQGKYEVPEGELDSSAEEAVADENFEALRARVNAALARGELSSHHPDYIKYRILVRRFHGRGGYDVLPPTGPLAGRGDVAGPA